MTKTEQFVALRKLIDSGMGRELAHLLVERHGPAVLTDLMLYRACEILDLIDGTDQEDDVDRG